MGHTGTGHEPDAPGSGHLAELIETMLSARGDLARRGALHRGKLVDFRGY